MKKQLIEIFDSNDYSSNNMILMHFFNRRIHVNDYDRIKPIHFICLDEGENEYSCIDYKQSIHGIYSSYDLIKYKDHMIRSTEIMKNECKCVKQRVVTDHNGLWDKAELYNLLKGNVSEVMVINVVSNIINNNTTLCVMDINGSRISFKLNKINKHSNI